MPWLSEDTRSQLERGAEYADRVDQWPTASWESLMADGVGRWSIPVEYGGDHLPQQQQLAGSEQIAACCLTTAFILSQREAAIRHVLRGPTHLKKRYLPDLATGNSFITIGLSQLTTSRQHRAPSLRVKRTSSKLFVLDGEIPWVTGAPRASAFVIGATFDNNEQAIFLLPSTSPGVRVGKPLELSCLVGSQTCSVHCENSQITGEYLLAGPKPQVLGGGGGGGGGLETSCLAIGLSRAAVSFLEMEARSRNEVRPITNQIMPEVFRLHGRLNTLATNPSQEESLSLRVECTLLALRSTQAALLFAKGTGFVRPHAVQRWARQALFFLVWSCPRSVSEQVSRGLLAVES